MHTAEQSSDPSKPISAIRKNQVVAMTGLSLSTIYRLEMKNDFPKRRRYGANSVFYVRQEVEDWLLGRSIVTRGVNRSEDLK